MRGGEGGGDSHPHRHTTQANMQPSHLKATDVFLATSGTVGDLAKLEIESTLPSDWGSHRRGLAGTIGGLQGFHRRGSQRSLSEGREVTFERDDMRVMMRT